MQARLSQGEDAALSQTHSAWGGQRRVSLRWVLVHMIEEYARHNGHADLIRESIEGRASAEAGRNVVRARLAVHGGAADRIGLGTGCLA